MLVEELEKEYRLYIPLLKNHGQRLIWQFFPGSGAMQYIFYLRKNESIKLLLWRIKRKKRKNKDKNRYY